MGVGLFLDVDNTLTVGFIQERFATLLGVVDKYSRLEADFQATTITSPDFGRRIVALFNEAGFTRDFAGSHFDDVEQQDYTPHLLRLPASIYLISSGPSYYVKLLAERSGIPASRVLCSEYDFGPDGKLLRCLAVSGEQKRLFVSKHRAFHTLTIGVGDNPKHDVPFISECDISILTTRNAGILYAESLELIMSMVNKLSSRFVHREQPTVFIGCSAERLNLADALHANLDRDCDPTIWRDGVFKVSTGNIESLEKALGHFDFAAFIMTPDDVLKTRGSEQLAVRDNIIFEMGLFIGRLGRKRCFLIHPRGDKPKLPSDLDGMVFLDYPHKRDDNNAGAALRPAAAAISSAIRKLGVRP